MNIGSVVGSYSQLQSQAIQRKPEAAEVRQGSSDKDGDSDDAAANAVPAADASTVNMSGQKIGQLVNITA